MLNVDLISQRARGLPYGQDQLQEEEPLQRLRQLDVQRRRLRQPVARRLLNQHAMSGTSVRDVAATRAEAAKRFRPARVSQTDTCSRQPKLYYRWPLRLYAV